MPNISCPKCQFTFEANETYPPSQVQCPSCGEVFEMPIPPPTRPPEGGDGGVFILGALLLAGVVILVILFWGGLLKKHNVRPAPKPDGRPGMRQRFQICRLPWEENSYRLISQERIRPIRIFSSLPLA
jgi:hypothetical protein